MHFNFARVNQTLRVNPAMEACVSNRVWMIGVIVAPFGLTLGDSASLSLASGHFRSRGERLSREFARAKGAHMAEAVEHFPARIDYSKIPRGFEGQWVVVRVYNQQPLGFGETLQAALEQAGILAGDQTVIVGRVPFGLVAL